MKRLLAGLHLAVLPAMAQCVMCFRTAEAQQAARAQVLNMGVLMLGVPPFLILAGYCVLFYMKNKVTADHDSGPAFDLQPASAGSGAAAPDPTGPVEAGCTVETASPRN